MTLQKWYRFHLEDYEAVKDRLRACRNVMLHGRVDSAAAMLEKSCVHAVLSIQTARDRHERAFTMYYAGGVSLERACAETVYHNQKARWLHDSLANVDMREIVTVLRDGGAHDAHAKLVDEFTGLSWVKAAFALAMCGVWELACPDSRTKQVLDIEGRVDTRADYKEAMRVVDEALNVDEPLFIKQWAMYDYWEEEHARHMAFFREALGL